MILRAARLIGVWCLLSGSVSLADGSAARLEYGTENNIAYYDAAALSRADQYQKEQGKLDVYYPKGAKGFATVVWFHGGGLTGGSRYFPNLKDQGIALVAASYRLAPKVQPPAYIEDAAAAVAWTLKNIGRYGGDPAKVFVAGHSAGAYLATMLAMDPKWLDAYELSNKSLAGVIAVSGQMTTHFTVKQQRGDTGPPLRPLIDEYAPLYHTANEFPPICMIVGGRDIEFKSRVEENELMAVTLRNLGHKNVEFYEMAGLDHGTVAQGAMIVVRGFIQRTLKAQTK
ncbi:alpha/beta hydrolase [Peristeroidobacter soli]|uniref:alpha/beta hydrolase n=1 Tax=Peristeroidobacter soli TaxID=2497877 RepID=UPI0013006348|nr:alpha/beta hydrolase [Peristeroidobacter soli]